MDTQSREAGSSRFQCGHDFQMCSRFIATNWTTLELWDYINLELGTAEEKFREKVMGDIAKEIKKTLD